MIKCVYDECQWPECDKTCGLAPTGDYEAGSSAEERLIYHLQHRVDELLAENAELRQKFEVARSCVRQINNIYIPNHIEKRLVKGCKFGYEDCIHNPEYIRYHYPDWWVELGMPVDCPNCNEDNCYDDEDK